MKKYKILLAITALIFASLACQTLMGGGNSDRDSGDETQVQPLPPIDNGNSYEPTEESFSGDVTIGGESPFPVTSDAFNVVSTSDTVAYQTKLSGDEVIKFYQDEFTKLGYIEDTSMTTNFAGILAMSFSGHESGKQIILGGAPMGDGSMIVTIALQ